MLGILYVHSTQFSQARRLVTRITCVMRNVTGPKDQGTVMPRFLVTSALGAHSISVKSVTSVTMSRETWIVCSILFLVPSQPASIPSKTPL